MQLPSVATTTVGSFPRPSWLADRTRSEVVFQLTGEALREAQDDATRLVLKHQEDLGLDLLTDGEQRRVHFIFHFLQGLDGIDLQHRQLKAIRRRETAQNLVPRIVGQVRRRSATVAEDFRFARAQSNRAIKMAVPGPMTVVDTTVDAAYGDEEALAMDVAAALNQELLELQAAGCDVVQIDEPAMTRWHEKVAAYGARALDRCLEGITIPSVVHLCYGYPGGDPRQHQYEYPELLRMLMQTRIGGFSVEFARSQFDPAVLQLCAGRTVVFGCVDPGPTPPEPLQVVTDRVWRAMEYVDPSRLLLAPDCGLMTISREMARQKCELLVAVAREVRPAA